MDYKRIYDEFITDRKSKEPVEFRGYSYFTRRSIKAANGVIYENHHIKPRHAGGNNADDNIVALTPSEHFFAHLLLAKSFGGKEWAAVWATVNAKTQHRTKDKKYAYRTRKWVELIRNKAANANTGERHTRSVPVVCVSTGDVYVNMTAAQKMAGKSGLINALRHGRKFDGKYWARADQLDSTNKDYLNKLVKEMAQSQVDKKLAGDVVAGEKRTKWTKNLIHAEALKYNTRSDFAKCSGSAYVAARKMRILNKICSHMKAQRNYFDPQKVIALARTYPTLWDFGQENKEMKNFAQTNPIVKKALFDMKRHPSRVSETLKEMQMIASKYKSMMEFHAKHRKLYSKARTNGWLNELFPSNRKKVVNLDTMIVYNTQKEAANDTGAHPSKISECCIGSRKTAGGYRWAYYKEAA